MFLATPFALIAPAEVSAFGQNSDIWPFDETKLSLTDSGNSITDGSKVFKYHSPAVDPMQNVYGGGIYTRLSELDNENRVYTLDRLFTDDDSLSCKTTGDDCRIAYALLISFEDMKNNDLSNVEVYVATYNFTTDAWVTGGWQSGWESAGFVSVQNPQNTMLGATIVSAGRFWGGIIQDNWASGQTVAEAFNTGSGISLIYNGAELAKRAAGSATPPENRYMAFTIDDGDMPKVLSIGKYAIAVDAKDKFQDCTPGDPSAGVCSVRWTGRIEFELLNENGTAYYKIIKSTAPGIQLNTKKALTGDFNHDFDISVSENIVSPFDDFFENALQNMTEWTTKAIVIGGGWVNKILMYGNDIRGSGTDSLQKEWQAVRNITLSILTLGILIIAFANILNFDLEKYGLNKMIPKLVLGILGTYFSFFICAILLEVASALQNLLLSGNTLDMAKIGNIDFEGFRSGATGAAGMAVAETIFLILLLIIVVVAMLYLVIVLIVRVVVIWFLVALAPLAFMMNVLPFTEFLFKQWWSKFAKWVFMGPAIAFLLWLTNSFLVDGFGTSFSTSATANTYNSWIFLLMAAAGIVMSAAIPTMMGGDIFSAIKKAASVPKKAFEASKKVPVVGKVSRGISNRLDLRRGVRDQREKTSALLAQDKWAQKGWVGRRIAGTRKHEADQVREAAIGQMITTRGLAKKSDGDLMDLATSDMGIVGLAAARTVAARGRAVITDAPEAAAFHHHMSNDGVLTSSMFKDNAGAIASMETFGSPYPDAKGMSAFKSISTKSPREWKREQVRLLSEKAKVAGSAERSYLISQLGNGEALNGILRSNDPALKASIGQMLIDHGGLVQGSLAHDIARAAGTNVTELKTFVDAAKAQVGVLNQTSMSLPETDKKRGAILSYFDDKPVVENIGVYKQAQKEAGAAAQTQQTRSPQETTTRIGPDDTGYED